MVGIAVGHEDAIDLLGIRRRRSAKPAREVTGEHLVVAAIHENDLAVGRLDHGAVALLDVHAIDLEDVVLIARANDVGGFDAG